MVAIVSIVSPTPPENENFVFKMELCACILVNSFWNHCGDDEVATALQCVLTV